MATTALETIADYVADIRVLLQDSVAPYRYPDSDILVALNVTILETRRLRADLFIGRFGALPYFTAVDATEFTMELPFRLAIVYGATAHALTRDQEDIQDERASTFLRTFTKMLTGVDTTPSTDPRARG